MDKENIKKALDHFENDQFVDATEIIQREIGIKKDEFLKNKLGLKGEITKKEGE